jgi:hypothetical protein
MNDGPGSRPPSYEFVIAFLSEDEVASVNARDAALRVSDLDECLDLEQLDQGVRRGPGPPRPICRVLARKAVHEATWANILMWLDATKGRTIQLRAGRAPRGTRLAGSRLGRGAAASVEPRRKPR